jgi:predicted DNA-binding transcriptional regulator YafY
VPVIGEVGSGYSLMEGYRLPPIMFTKEEAIAFLTAEKLVEKLTDTATFKVYQSAMIKIKAVLRGDEKAHLENMYEHIEVIDSANQPKNHLNSKHIQVILKSIAQKQVLTIQYLANHSQEKTKRNIEAVGIFYSTNNWYLMAYCWLRKEYRTFKLDRILVVQPTDLTFQKQHPPLKTYLAKLFQEHQELQKVVILVDKDALKYFGEQKYFHGFVSEREFEDKIEMTFLTSSLEGFARWYMMIGDSTEIVIPALLKTRIKQMANHILNKINE